MSLIVSVEPTAEPVTLAEAKIHLRVDNNDEDSYITDLIIGARQMVETHTNRALVDTTFVYKIDAFPPSGFVDSRVLLPRSPLDSVSSVTYLDTNGDSQTLATSVYEVDTSSLPGRIRLKFDQSWPNTRLHPEVITITFIAGYGDETAVPDSLKSAVYLLLAHYFELRVPVLVTQGGNVVKIAMGVEHLMRANAVIEFA